MRIFVVTTVTTMGVTLARAQPAPEPGPGSDAGSDVQPPPPPPPPVVRPVKADTPPVDPYPERPRPKPDPKIDLPTVLLTPTGWLLPAAVMYSRTAVDTGGGVTSDARVGLGDVAEFGVATTDDVREKTTETDSPQRIQPYAVASFRMGVSEGRLFPQQPGIVLGFRKSFERNHDGFKTRIAELTLVASKHLGDRAAMHLGGAFWDASLDGTAPDGTEHHATLHGFNEVGRQVRAFAGIQVQPLDKSEILIDLSWAPEFCYECTGNHQIRLRPELSWGVRYEVADWMHLESGVRVPNIGDANLLDAQIFGQVTLTSWALHHAVDRLK